MAERRVVRSVGSGIGPDPPSALFQQLCAEYRELPRRIVGDVLSQVYGATWQSAPETVGIAQVETAASALLDAIRVRVAEAAGRTGPSCANDIRTALDSDHDVHTLTRAERLADAIETRALSRGVASTVSLLCEAAVEHLRVAAVAVSVPGGLLSAQTVGAAGALARPLEELQVVLGEGPSFDGLRYGTSVLVENLSALPLQARWPLYAPAAQDRGASAQFVLPMQVGAARFGVLVLYQEHVGGLAEAALGDAQVFAEVALGWLIDDVAGCAPSESTERRGRPTVLDDRAEIHQATGMVSVQLEVDLSIALLRLRARAFADDCLLSDLAFAVVARTVRFRPEDADDEHEREATA